MDSRHILEICDAQGGNPLAAEKALQAIRRAAADELSGYAPQVGAARRHVPRAGQIVTAIEAPSRILVVDPPTVTAATQSAPISINLLGVGPGELVGMMGAVATVAGAPSDLIRMSVQVRINDDERIVTTGEVDAFASFDALFRQTNSYFPIRRRLGGDDRIVIQYENQDAATDLVPHLLLFYSADRDCRRDQARQDHAY